jgi:hypothetical protein
MRRGILLASVVLVGALSSACASDQMGSAATQLSTWVKGTDFETSTSQIRSDMAKATELVGRTNDPAQAHTLCGVILVEVQAANQNLPSPDIQTTDLLGPAYNALGEAANDCYASVGDPAKQAAFAQHRREGLVGLTEAQLRIESVTGTTLTIVTEPPAATTTTP